MPPRPLTLEPYARHLRRLPFVESLHLVEPGSEGGEDGPLAELVLVDGSRAALRIELKSSHLDSHGARHIGRSVAHPAGWLVAAPYIGAPLGESLVSLGLNFVDHEGNCHLRIGDRFLARVQGKTPAKPAARSKAMRGAGYRVLFALLAEPDLVGASQRDIAAAAGTSRQPVADLLRRLREERLVVKRRGEDAWVEGPDARLLERWLAGYEALLRPRLVVGRYRLPVREPKDVEDWLAERLERVRFGGTAGAHRLEPHYRGPLTVAHLGPFDEGRRRALKAVPAEEGELVWMGHIGEVSKRGATEDTVHPLLIHAELSSDPDPRAHEAADLIRRNRLPWSL